MSKLTKFWDDYFFAPARYLDKGGNMVDANGFMNTVHAPHVKTGAITAIALSVVFASVNDTPASKIIEPATIGFGISLILAGSRKNSYIEIKEKVAKQIRSDENYQYYFDTKPNKKKPIPTEDVLRDLASDRKWFPKAIALDSVLIAAIPPVSYLGTAPGEFNESLMHLSLIFVPASVSSMTVSTSLWWYARQAMDGNWNVLTTPPEKEQKEAKATQVSYAPA